MSEWTAQQCKAEAIKQIHTAWTHNVEERAVLLQEAHIWALLATVPDALVETPPDTTTESLSLTKNDDLPWRSSGGAGQWNG